MTTRIDDHAPFDESIDRRLHSAGGRLHAQVNAEVDVNRRLHELTSVRRMRRGWWMLGIAAGVTAAAVVVGVIVTSPAPVRIGPAPEFAGPAGDGGGDRDGAGEETDPAAEEDPSTLERPPAAPEETPADPDPERTDPAGIDCTIGALDDVGPPDGLPDAVVETRSVIMEAAVACDLDGLAALGGEGLNSSFGGGTDAAAFWRMQQEAGEAPLDVLALLLMLPPGGGDPIGDGEQAIWSWPRAYTDPSDPAHRAELDGTFGSQTVDAWFVSNDSGPDYYGPRVGIREDGTWMFYVAGD